MPAVLEIDYAKLGAAVESVEPRPPQRNHAPSVDDIKQALGRIAQVGELESLASHFVAGELFKDQGRR